MEKIFAMDYMKEEVLLFFVKNAQKFPAFFTTFFRNKNLIKF